ncbi:MAG: threonine-phosphate decarboxylase CobD [Hyphomicrobium sp.]
MASDEQALKLAARAEMAQPSSVIRQTPADAAADAAGGVPHGGNLDATRQRYPHVSGEWLDLSTGINPIAYPLPALAADLWQRLPDERAVSDAIAAAAFAYGVSDPAHIVAAPGTQALIQALPRLFPPQRVAVVAPTYEEHAANWRRQGHDVIAVSTLAEAHAAAAIVVVVNPNNPTGKVWSVDALRRAAEHCARKGGALIVDEAFVDLLDPGASVAAARLPETIVLRSFGKTYGLAGVRLGFAVLPSDHARRLKLDLGPWSVSGPALAIGAVALRDTAWREAVRHDMTRAAESLDSTLIAAGLKIFGGTPLFRLAACDDAAAIANRLAEHAIHVRTFVYQPAWVRFGVPTSDVALQRLASALAARTHHVR